MLASGSDDERHVPAASRRSRVSTATPARSHLEILISPRVALCCSRSERSTLPPSGSSGVCRDGRRARNGLLIRWRLRVARRMAVRARGHRQQQPADPLEASGRRRLRTAEAPRTCCVHPSGEPLLNATWSILISPRVTLCCSRSERSTLPPSGNSDVCRDGRRARASVVERRVLLDIHRSCDELHARAGAVDASR